MMRLTGTSKPRSRGAFETFASTSTRSQLRATDDLIDRARQHKMVVSAIVLIPRSSQAERLSPLVHPESDGGVYAMPDLLSERGVAIYSFVLDRIAERYHNAERAPGGITNWIAHNEVDFHPVWTNIGQQPRHVYVETPLITMQNLQVLGEFVSSPAMRNSRGVTRPVLLSEQGCHSASYSTEDQDRQAASLWYAMRKIRDAPWVESSPYHRWIDHPNEGGLLLGLRTLPSENERYGQRKRAWEVYRAFGTDRVMDSRPGSERRL